MAQLSTTAPLHRSLGSGGASHLDSPAVPGAHSMIIPVPATAASYSIALDSRFRHPGSSFLAAALEQSLEESQSHGGHLIASSRDWAGGSNRLGRGRLHYSAHMSPAERGQHLVARAKRTVTHPGAPGGVRGEGALQHQLSPGAIYGAAIYGACHMHCCAPGVFRHRHPGIACCRALLQGWHVVCALHAVQGGLPKAWTTTSALFCSVCTTLSLL